MKKLLQPYHNLCHLKWLGCYTLIEEEKIHQYMTTAKPSGPHSAKDWIQFSKAVLAHAHGSGTHKGVWVACAHIIHSLLPYITIS